MGIFALKNAALGNCFSSHGCFGVAFWYFPCYLFLIKFLRCGCAEELLKQQRLFGDVTY